MSGGVKKAQRAERRAAGNDCLQQAVLSLRRPYQQREPGLHQRKPTRDEGKYVDRENPGKSVLYPVIAAPPPRDAGDRPVDQAAYVAREPVSSLPVNERDLDDGSEESEHHHQADQRTADAQ